MPTMTSFDSVNPAGTDGFEFAEFTAPDAKGLQQLRDLFVGLGFTETAQHRTKKVSLFQQGDINFLVNAEPYSHFALFAETHGPCACAMAFRVKNAKRAFDYAISKGATPFEAKSDWMELKIPAVYGIGGSILYFVDRYGAKSIYDVDFVPIAGVDRNKNSVGLHTLDHLTHNVKRGNMNKWSGFYTDIANFREVRYFDIEGKLTGLLSRAMTSPCGKIRIPINESSDDKSQIEEFIKLYRGEGIQHIALSTDNIYDTVQRLRDRGIKFLSTPDTYYAKTDARVPGHGENLAELQRLQILVDGAPVKGDGILLQIFTDTVIGPIFFEVIQRKGNEGFGEGNFKALFESIEEDQIRRGVLKAEA